VAEVVEAASRRLDHSREEIAQSAAEMARALSQREASHSAQARRLDLGKQAVSDLGAFLEDYTDDIADAFTGAAFAAKEGYYKIHLDAAEVLVFPIDDVELPPHESAIAACSVQAALPGELDESWPAQVLATSSMSGLDCFANLICDVVNDRPRWSIATFSMANYPERGYHQSNVVGLRSEARGSQSSFTTMC
jgi:hypothetical protein